MPTTPFLLGFPKSSFEPPLFRDDLSSLPFVFPCLIDDEKDSVGIGLTFSATARSSLPLVKVTDENTYK